MASKQAEREDFLLRLARALPDLGAYQVGELGRKLLRAGATLQRLAAAQCNGDWPFDNGERKVEPCPRCEAGTVPGQLKSVRLYPGQGKRSAVIRLCPDCRTQDRVNRLAADHGLRVITQGDPRGYVLRVVRADQYQTDQYGHTDSHAPGVLGVPA